MGLRIGLLVLTVIGWVLIYLSERATVEDMYYNKLVYCRKANLLRAGLFNKTMLEMLIFALHPPVFLDYKVNMSFGGSDSEYNTDQLFTTLSTLKLYFILRVLPRLSIMSGRNATKICEINGIEPNYVFFLKVSLKERPLTFLALVLGFLMVSVGLTIQILERGLLISSNKGGEKNAFDFQLNSIWLMLVTFTTVGYGDITPHSNFGRLLTICSCFAGNFLIQIITLTMMRKLELSTEETAVYNHFDNLKQRDQYKLSAVTFLQKFARYILITRLEHMKIKQKRLSIDDFKRKMTLKYEMTFLKEKFQECKLNYVANKVD